MIIVADVLDGQSGRDRWLSAWEMTGREPFAHPDFLHLFAAEGDVPTALLLSSPGGEHLLPLLIRQLTLDSGHTLRDAVSPYGYGGPFGPTPVLLDEAARATAEWFADNELCTGFIRLSLDVDGAAPEPSPSVEVVVTAPNVAVDLRRAEDETWSHYEHKVRKNVQKARRSGCTVSCTSSIADVDTFAAVYGSTMQRRSAASWYHFDAAFFARLDRQLQGQFEVFWVRDADGVVVSVELVLTSDERCYSFLGGTLSDAFHLSPNDLLKHEVIRVGREKRRRAFVLGGGASPDDGIFRYKRAFDREGVTPFRTMRLVGTPEVYTELADCVDAPDASLSAARFPFYRFPM